MAFVGLWVQVYYYPHLPHNVAIHFNALGQADGWASKQKFCLINSVLLFGMAALFEAMIWFLPKLPVELINIPRRSYWLASERKRTTMERLVHYILWISNLTMLFLFGLTYVITLANYFGTFRLGTIFWVLFILYIIAIGLLTVELLIGFFTRHKA